MSNATQIVHWPGKDTPACDSHAAKLRNLGAVLGCPVSATPIPDENVECVNCVNEAKKAKGEL